MCVTLLLIQTIHRPSTRLPVDFSHQWARSSLTNHQAVKQNPLVVFMKGTPDAPQCGFSRAVCQILDVQGVPRESLKSFNCLEDQELRAGIKEYSEWPTIPQVYVKGEFVGGCDIVLSSESCRRYIGA